MNKTTHTVLLGFDFGMKRIGVAVGQTVTKTARPLATLNAMQGVPQWNVLDKLIKTWQPDGLIVGIPLNMDGTAQPITELARQFATQLHEHYQVPVYEMDERLSTKDARERIFAEGGYKALRDGQVDSVAAKLILQNWLTE
ncbi:MAG: Holliday junction resolvase RuvX [Gammaproteobacteria bacterium]